MKWEMFANEYGIFLWSDKNVLKLDNGYGCTLYKYTKYY